MKNSKSNICRLGVLFILTLGSCYPTEELNTPVKEALEVEAGLDAYIDENFIQTYGMAIRYKFIDNYVKPFQRVAPPKLEMVRPMLDFVQEFWIDPYLEIPNGEEFFRNHVPSEIVFLGGLIYNSNGSITLGFAEAGAQITFTDINSVDLDNVDWRTQQLNTVYHEFAHTVHQRYKLPNAFETIAAAGYTGPGSWFVLTDNDALERGFVSPYSTSSPFEDYVETVAFFLFDPDFDANFIDFETNCQTSDCESRNEGRQRIAEKLSSIHDHYQRVTGVNLDDLRAAIQSRL